MTPSELLELPDELAKLTDAQIDTYFASFFPHSRPRDLSPAGVTHAEKLLGGMSPEMQARIAALKAKQAPVLMNAGTKGKK